MKCLVEGELITRTVSETSRRAQGLGFQLRPSRAPSSEPVILLNMVLSFWFFSGNYS